ncbi:MAG TPA: transcription termination/antitermination protein NusA [Clostridiales bacterium]|nr:transcription termination/antitermination protein NusA [Clostridiales bacterium]
MNKEFMQAVEDLEREKAISKDLLIEAIESALVSAYKKNYGTSQNVRVNIDRETGDIDVFMRKNIVDVVEDPFVEVHVDEAKEIDPAYEIGDIIEYQVTPMDFGRIAAQTAKQVVVQRIRETERSMIYDDFINRQTEVVTGVVQRISNDKVFINMGRAEGILNATEQIPGEKYRVNQRLKVYVMDVKKTTKGPQVFLSRTHPGLVKRLFELEVPEIQDGIVEIRSISREAGSRTKIAVCTYDENVDPVGACVGTRGNRVQAVVEELSGEKIDIITWSDEPGRLISSALSPAKVEMVLIDEEEKAATVVVPDFQLSLAIGKEGQNVRLAAKLSGWKIDIKSHSQYYPDESADEESEFTDEFENDDIQESDEQQTEQEASAGEAGETEEAAEATDEGESIVAELIDGEEAESEEGAVSADGDEDDEEE